MKKIFLILCMLSPFLILAQGKDYIAKQATKAEKLVKDEKNEEAAEIYKDLSEKYKENGDIWTRLVQVQLMVYQDKQKFSNLFSNIKVSTTSVDGKDVTNDSLSNSLTELFKNIDPAADYLENDVMYTCRMACIYTDKALMPSIYLRTFNVDEHTDAVTNKEANRYFNLAEKDFSEGNYKEAIALYKKATEADPGHYKAQLYLGDSYYMLKEYVDAIREFKKAIEKKPYLLEPRKYLADAYYYAGLYDKSFEACKEGFLIYPDFSMKDKLEGISDAAGKPISLQWIPRSVLPNKIPAKPTGEMKLKKKAKEIAKAKDSWAFYQEALPQIQTECDENGIIKSTTLTQDKYLEVYSWHAMLKKSAATEYTFAKEMDKIGFLDCYVFLSCFHYDFYEQYKHFVSNNTDRINQYFLMLQKK